MERFEKLGEDLLKAKMESRDATLGQAEREQIVLWLRERRDIAERHDRTLRWIAWVTVFFVVLGFLLDHVFASHSR